MAQSMNMVVEITVLSVLLALAVLVSVIVPAHLCSVKKQMQKMQDKYCMKIKDLEVNCKNIWNEINILENKINSEIGKSLAHSRRVERNYKKIKKLQKEVIHLQNQMPCKYDGADEEDLYY